jgi:hypothetical protein
MAATLVDSMDTLLLAGMEDEVALCEKWIEDNLHFRNQVSRLRNAFGLMGEADLCSVHQGDVNVFETTIRVMGGLLATYEMRGTRVLLERAVEVAQTLEIAFQTWVTLRRAHGPL